MPPLGPQRCDIRIVCTHDAVKFAEMLLRLLGAEQHQVRLLAGRQSLAELEAAKTAQDAVLLIWSANAPSQHYMREWARNIPPGRLIEIARAPGWPQGERRAPVIDFIDWRGQRGARAWNSLNDRLRIIARVLEPTRSPTPKRAVMALGLASIAAVSGAAMLRMHDAPAAPSAIATQDPPEQTIEAIEAIQAIETAVGVGGPLGAAPEPPSAEEIALAPQVRFGSLEPMRLNLVEIPEYLAPELRAPTLLERLNALNPLRDISFNDDSDEEEDG